MDKNRKPRRGAIALAAALATAGGAGLALMMATSAGAVTSAAPGPARSSTYSVAPPGTSAPTQSPNTVGSQPPPASTAPATAQARTSTSSSASTAPLQLAATQLPAASAEKWAPAGPANTRNIAGHDISENECAEVEGATTWTQQAFSGGDGQNTAIQDTFAFPTAGAAESAYQHAVNAMDTCRQTTLALQTKNKVSPDAKVTQTATEPAAAAWKRTWTGVMGMSADGPQTNHIYFAVNGARLIVLQFTEYPGHAAPYDTAADPRVLTMLTNELAE